MKRYPIMAAAVRGSILSVALTTRAPAASPDYNVVFRAMEDELGRTTAQLRMEELEPPYFVAYTVDDFQSVKVSGTLGAVTESRLERSRYVTVELRVGDTALDNSRFVTGFFPRGPAFAALPLSDDYDALRNRIYLETDRAYKAALKTLSRKRAYLQNRVIEDRPADFIPPAAGTHAEEPEPFDGRPQDFEALVCAASRVFREYPGIVSSQIMLEMLVTNQCLVNSRNTRALRSDRVCVVRLTMRGKSADGQDVTGSDRMIVRRPEDLPDQAALSAWARANADILSQQLAEEPIEHYAGPVILVGDAAGEFLRQLFAANISGCPAPLNEEDGASRSNPAPEFEERLKRRVLPENMDACDDPTITRIGDIRLVGSFETDDAGQPSRRIELVERGRLVDLPLGTAPTRQLKQTNGHARGAVSKPVEGRPGNLILEARGAVAMEELRQELLSLCREFDLEYGLIIERLRDLNEQDDAPMTSFGGSSGQDGGLTEPRVAWKLYPDGRQVPSRNLEFAHVSVRNLRDIVAASGERTAYHYLIAADPEMPATIVTPALLIEELELKKSSDKIRKPPILPSPLAGN